MTASEMFQAITPQLGVQILDSVWQTDKELYRVALNATAQSRRVRPIYLERQPRGQRHQTMLATLLRPDLNLVAGNLISGWLVKSHSTMLAEFLDALKITHDKGVVESLPQQVEDEVLKGAIDQLLAKYPAEVVGLYLHAFNDLNEANWANLRKILAEDARLFLGQSTPPPPAG